MVHLLHKAQDFIQDAHLQPSTLTQYAYSLGLLARGGVERVSQVNRTTVRRFLLERRRAGASPATVARNLAALCSFLGYLESLDEFPLEELEKIRTLFKTLRTGPPKPPDFLTPEQFWRLIDTCLTVAPELALAVAVAVHTGVRLEELRSLWTGDFVLDVPEAFVRVQRTHDRRIKTEKERTAPIARYFADELLKRGFHGHDGPIFPATRLRRAGDEPVSPYLAVQTLQGWLREASRKAGIRCNWITFRHTYASRLVQEGVGIAKVAKFLGNGIVVCFQHYASLIPGGDSEVEKGFKAFRRAAVDGKI